MANNRRRVVKGIIAAASLGTFIYGYYGTVDKILRPSVTIYGPDKIDGPEVRYVYSSCLGCNVRCGIRVRIINVNGVQIVERIEGNPYHVYNRAVLPEKQIKRYNPLPYSFSARESLKYTGTLCARGQDGIHYLYDPYRVVKPLKRAGPRGSGRWKTISWEQLIDEIVNGGVIEETGERLPGIRELFTYGVLRDARFEDPNNILSRMKEDVNQILSNSSHLTFDELRKKIEEFKSKWEAELNTKGLTLSDILIDPDRPDLGTKANQIVFVRGRGQGHSDDFSQRWVAAIGSINWLRHTSSCQLGYYAGNRIWAGYTDINPDVRGAKVLIMAGAQIGRLHPGATGQGLIIERAAEGELKVYYVNPVAPRGDCNGNFIWVPIKPGTDAALAMAMVRWIIENGRYNKIFLESPNEESAKKKGEIVYTNATWLVITEDGHPRGGTFLRASDIGKGEKNQYVVVYNGELVPYDTVDEAELFYAGKVKLSTGEEVEVKTALQILKDEAFSRSIEEWCEICGVPVETVVRMAFDFTNAGRAASTYIHRGVGMQPNGEYSVWAYRTLDLLIGNYHRRGGLMARADTTNYNGALYNTGPSNFGEPVKWGPPIDRHGVAYEDTLEYWVRLKRDGNAYPAKRPWYPLTPEESYTEIFAGIDEGYPYPVKALFMYYANPVLAANFGIKFIKVLRDTEKLPLFVAITTTINETFLYADYIIPDTTYLETGTLGIQYLYASSAGVRYAEAWRVPVVPPMTMKIGEDPNGYPRYSSLWEFLIDLAKKLGTPGYGERSIPGVKETRYEGKWFPLHSIWDYIMRVYANGAVDAVKKGLIPEQVPVDDVKFVEENYWIARFKDIVPSEWPWIAYAMARGGVFTSYDESYDENGVVKRKPKRTLLEFWDEKLAMTRNSVTGQRFYGGPKYFPPATYAPIEAKTTEKWLQGTPLREIWPEDRYPFLVIMPGSPLYTKHRSQFYYWMKQIMPRNYAVLHPRDAARLGVDTGDIVKIETPNGYVETPVLVEPTTAPGIITIPVGMGRWADTAISKPEYFEIREKELKELIEAIPEKTEIPEDAVNPLKVLPEISKKTLFTKSNKEFYESSLAIDEWRFNGITLNVIASSDPSLKDWPLLSWVGASQVYFYTPAKVTKTGEKEKITFTNMIW